MMPNQRHPCTTEIVYIFLEEKKLSLPRWLISFVKTFAKNAHKMKNANNVKSNLDAVVKQVLLQRSDLHNCSRASYLFVGSSRRNTGSTPL